jgi:outer membrane protein assembly factor BamB
LRVPASALLVSEALLVVQPVLAVSNLFVGAAVIGKGLAVVGVPDVVGQGLAFVAAPFTVLLLLLGAWGVAHSARGLGALVLQLPVIGFAAVPFLRPMGIGPAWLLAVVAAVTTVVLVVLVVRSPRDRTGRRRWWWLAGFAGATAALAGFGATSTALPFNPTAALASSGSGGPRPGSNLPAVRPPQNPALAPNPFNNIHNDAWATDAYNLPTPADPRDAETDSLFTGGDCATMAWDSQGRLITLCPTLTRTLAYVIDPATLEVLDRRVVGERRPRLTDFSGGGYFVLDAQDQIVFPARGGTLRVLATTEGLPEVDSIDVSATLQPDEQVTSVLPDFSGRYWYVGARGTVGVVRDGRVSAINLGGEDIENSFAVDGDDVYIVTGAALYRLTAGDSGEPTVVWSTPYDRGTQRKPGQTSRASGTTPTIFDEWVAITDNAEPRMNVLVVNRQTGEVTCEVPVFAEGASATDNSLIAVDGALIVENNYGYAPPVTSVAGGHTTEPGLTAIDVDRLGSCSVRWANAEIRIPSLVSKATTVGGLVLTYTKPPSRIGAEAWYFTAVDLRTGEVVWTRRAGAGGPFNNHYAAGYLTADGDFFVGTLNGLAVLRGAP